MKNPLFKDLTSYDIVTFDNEDIQRVPFGILPLDVAIGGGMPMGRVAEVFGPESCLDENTFIQYCVCKSRDAASKANHKGGSIKRLYERFHDKPADGDGRGKYKRKKSYAVTFTAPSINEDGRIIQNEITNVVHCGVQECFTVKTATGNCINATANHKFWNGSRFVKLSDLVVGDVAFIHDNDLRFVAVPDVITEINPCGQHDTYDLQMKDPYRNYIANHFVVHNSGKTTLVLTHCKHVQEEGGYVIYNDAEVSLEEDDPRLTQLGVSQDTDKWQLGQPDSVENMFSDFKEASLKLRAKFPKRMILNVIDSIASAPSEAELKGSGQLNTQALAFNQQLRRCIKLLKKNKISLIGINHEREKMGIMFGDKITTPGGRALKFYSALRLRITMISKLAGKTVNPFGFNYHPDDKVGFLAEVTSVKNKVSEPWKTCYLLFLLNHGFHSELSMFETMRRLDIAKSKGQMWRFKGVEELTDKKEMIEFVRAHRDALCESLRHRYFDYKEEKANARREETEADD